MEKTKIKWLWDASADGHHGIIVDSEGFTIANLATLEGSHSLIPILEHIVTIHNQDLEGKP